MGVYWLLAEINPTLLLLAGIAVLTSVMVRLSYRRARGRRPHAPDPSTLPASAVPGGSYRDLLRRLEEKELEIEELSRGALARLDNKIAILEQLLGESNAAIARLEEVQQRKSASEKKSA